MLTTNTVAPSLSPTAERGAIDLFNRLKPDVPNLVSVVAGQPFEGIPTLVVMLSSKLIPQCIPRRFRGMRVLTCLLPKRPSR